MTAFSPSDQASLVPEWWERASSAPRTRHEALASWSVPANQGQVLILKEREGKERQGRGKGKERKGAGQAFPLVHEYQWPRNGWGWGSLHGRRYESVPVFFFAQLWRQPTTACCNDEDLEARPLFCDGTHKSFSDSHHLSIDWKSFGVAVTLFHAERTHQPPGEKKSDVARPSLWPWSSNSLDTVVVVCLLPAYESHTTHSLLLQTHQSGRAPKFSVAREEVCWIWLQFWQWLVTVRLVIAKRLDCYFVKF